MISGATGREAMHFFVFLLVVAMLFVSKSISLIFKESMSPRRRPVANANNTRFFIEGYCSVALNNFLISASFNDLTGLSSSFNSLVIRFPVKYLFPLHQLINVFRFLMSLLSVGRLTSVPLCNINLSMTCCVICFELHLPTRRSKFRSDNAIS